MNPAEQSPILPHSLSSEDINERYGKLSAEYQRIKAQNSILKKAVIQEQQKVAGLEKELREAELKLRQATEETDILQFNNQRLTKRISVMQEETAAKSKEGGWRWGSSRDLNKKVEELDVLRADLEEKIRENEQMHIEKRDLEEDIKQSIILHSEQAQVLKECVKAKQEEVDKAVGEIQKVNDSLNQLHEDMQRQESYHKEADEKLVREVQHIIAEINQSRKIHKQAILHPSAAPPSPLAIWRDNKHTRDLIGTFKDLYYAVESHWDTHLDKITLLRSLNPPEQLSLIYKELAATIPSLSTQLTHISESLQQYLPILFSKEALPNVEFADTLHRFVNTCKKWLSYQQLRHVELSQQGMGLHQQTHSALADIHAQVLRALDRLVADREVSAIRSLSSILSALSDSTRTLYAQEASGFGEGGMGKGTEGSADALVSVNERLLETQAKTASLLDKFAMKLDEYESLASSGRLLQEGEDSHRLREIASHLIMLNNDITVATKEREFQHLSMLRDSEGLKHKLKELDDVITRKDGELKELESRLNMARDQTQEVDNLRKEKEEQEKAAQERHVQLTQAHERALAEQKGQLDAAHAQIVAASLARSQAELSGLRVQLDDTQRTVDQLRQELSVQTTRASDAERLLAEEKQRLESHRADLNANEGRTNELKRNHESVLLQSRTELEGKQKQVQDLQARLVGLEGTYRTEMAEKAQQVKVLQQKLMVQEQKLEERTRQVQAAERFVAEKEQQLVKLQKNFELAALNGTTVPVAPLSPVAEMSLLTPTPLQLSQPMQPMQPLVPSPALSPVVQSQPHAQSLLDTDIPEISPLAGDLIKEDVDVSSRFSQQIVIPEPDTTVPLTPTMSSKAPKYSMTVVDEAGEQSNGLNVATVDKEREQALKEYYEGKMQHLSYQMKASDAKALQLFEQYSSLLKALEEKEAERSSLLDQIKSATNETKNSKEDLESTRSNYDMQLRMLSENLLELGEKIQALEAESGAVKGCKVACGKCKTWNTIEWLITEGKGGQRCVKGNHPLATFMV